MMMRGEVSKEKPGGGASFKEIRDMYGFTVQPQHLQRYRKHANIYKEEEVERSERWETFLRTLDNEEELGAELSSSETNGIGNKNGKGKDAGAEDDVSSGQRWRSYTSSLSTIEQALRKVRQSRTSRESGLSALLGGNSSDGGLKSGASGNGEDDESDDEFYDVERTDVVQDGSSVQDGSEQGTNDSVTRERDEDYHHPWAEELKVLVCGGVPGALRGELWQVFVGANDRRVDGYYQALLARQGGGGEAAELAEEVAGNGSDEVQPQPVVEKWTNQIEKDLPRTFPGHPALGEDGLNALRRMLTAYARHNPAVGYCQAMNFLAALLLLLMPEEDAFWTLTSILDDYFEGYYSEKMVEAQVDQLVFEQLVRERFPRLATHLESLGVQVAWVSGPWFLSIFVNVLPWETVLRVWDVLLYEGNRSMLFRTGLALIESHANTVLQQRDTGDAVAMLQSMGESTFDSSQLVLSACLGFQVIQEKLLQELRIQHRPAVLAALHERSMELHLWRAANGIGSKHTNGVVTPVKTSLIITENGTLRRSRDNGLQGLETEDLEEDEETESVDLQEQVAWLKTELCAALEVSKAATHRAEELESALVEMVKEDNRRLLSAKVEKLEADVANLKQALSDKQEQEAAMVQVLVRMEQEQHVAEDARRFAEQEAEAHRLVAEEAQRKASKAVEELAAMEKRVVMAESMLEATLNFQSGGAPQTSRRGSDLIKDSGPKGIARSHSSPAAKQDPDSAWARRNSTGKLDGADEVPNTIPSKPSIFGRGFSLSWRDKSKLHVETKATEFDNVKGGVIMSPDSGLPVLKIANGHVSETSSESAQVSRAHQTSDANGKQPIGKSDLTYI